MSATRLPGKPLLKINGLSIISHVSKVAEEANIGDVIVATEDQEIIDDVKSNGFNAILTSNKHKNLKNENIVKVITENSLEGDHFPKAVSFSRKSEQVENIYHHIGIYCYSRDCLEKFVHLNQSKNEIENRLEQLRALDNNIDINVSLAKSSPIGVDTEEDYLALKKIMEYKN